MAAKVGVKAGTLGNWIKKYREENPEKFDTGEHDPVSFVEHQKVVAENAKVKQGVEFLGKDSLDSTGRRSSRSGAREIMSTSRRVRSGYVGISVVAENFFSYLKTEFYHHHSFATQLAARTAVMDYIESWYNRQRPNARADHRVPVQALSGYRKTHQTCLAA